MNRQHASVHKAEPQPIMRSVLATAEDTGDRCALVMLTLPPHHPGIAAHAHPGHTEGCYVQEGTLAVTIDEQTITLTAGTAVRIPAGVNHSAWNPTAVPTILILIYSPGTSAAVAEALAQGPFADQPPVDDTF